MGTSDLLSAGITRNIHAGHNNLSGPLGAYRSTYADKLRGFFKSTAPT
jgi:hypothetical protein